MTIDLYFLKLILISSHSSTVKETECCVPIKKTIRSTSMPNLVEKNPWKF